MKRRLFRFAFVACLLGCLFLAGCSLSFTGSDPVCEHSFSSEPTVLTPATCVSTGEGVNVCDVCHKSVNVTLPVSEEHVMKPSSHKDPSCLTKGNDVYLCSVCGYRQKTDISPLGHAYVWTTQPASCTADGRKDGVCSRCYDEKTEILPNFGGHAYVWTEVAATCTTLGERHGVCSVCQATKDEYSSKPAHNVTWTSSTDSTCTVRGVKTGTCSLCKQTVTEYKDLLPHTYEWVVTKAATVSTVGTKCDKCSVCGTVRATATIPRLNNALPILYLTGNYQDAGKETDVNMTVRYVDEMGEEVFNCYATINLQGGTSAGFPKKNYTMKLYKTDAYGDGKKQKVDLGWGKESKYCLKANYVDYTQARNIVSCRLWGQMVKSRAVSDLQVRLSGLSTNGGAVDGYPIEVYMNGTFHGLYTLNVPKDEWMFGMGDSETEAMIGTDNWTTAMDTTIANFTMDGNGDLKSGGYELKYYGTEKTTGDWSWVTQSFNRLITFNNTATDEEFRAHASEYVDVDACLDYFILLYTIYMRDNGSKNMLWCTYDGDVWFPTLYDQDGTFGMVWDGYRTASASGQIFSVKNGQIKHGLAENEANRICVRVMRVFADRFYERYQELRQTTLSESNVIALFESFIGSIPEDVYAADLEKWPHETYNSNPWRDIFTSFDLDYIKTWYHDRLGYVDDAFESLYNELLTPAD